jgi:hypothetical protein
MKAKRIFKGPDNEMVRQIITLQGCFEANQAAFEAYDPSLDSNFLVDWKAAMDIAKLIFPDYSEVLEGEVLLEDAVTALQACQTKYGEVKYFAGKAFPKNKEAMKEFGQGQFSKVRNSHLRMVPFMETLHGVATKYKVELIAKGYSQPAIDQITTLTDTLRADNILQQLKKKERPTESRKRIESLNAFYAFGQQVAQVAPRVFAQSAAKRHLFRLGLGKGAKQLKEWMSLSPGSLRKTSLLKSLKKFNLSLTNQGKDTIEYWRADKIAQVPVQKYLLGAGEKIAIEPEAPVRKFLVMHNTSAKEVRVMLKKDLKAETR